MVFLIDKILKALDEGEIVLGVFIDLSKAFYTVNHTYFWINYINAALEVWHMFGLQIIYTTKKQYVSFNKLDADDTNMFVTGENIENLICVMNTEFKKIISKFKKNLFFIFSFSNKRIVNTNDIVIDNQPVFRVSHTNFLSVIMDEKLNWYEHVNNLKIKLAKGSGIIKKCRICLSIDTLITLYYSCIYPYITYCLKVWGGANERNPNSIFILQNLLL